MADLDGLIKYRKHIVDEKQRFLAQLYRESEQIERQREVILDQMAKEEQMARDMQTPEAASYLGRYLEGARRKVKALDMSLKKMETRIIAAREDMRTAYAEMKKIQITQRSREAREDAEQKKKDDQELDEIALEGYRRQLEEE